MRLRHDRGAAPCVPAGFIRIPLATVVAALLLFSACMSPRTKRPIVSVGPEYVQSATRFRKQYVLAPGDAVEVVVRRVPHASRTVTLRPDGYISLPLLDDVKAAGLTPAALDAKLEELLASRLVDPDVTVIATQVRQPVVYVVGDVNRSAAVVPLRDAPTAMQAVAHAGGLAPSAARRDIAIIRLTEDGYLRANLITAGVRDQSGAMLALRGTLLQADDLVFVPESKRSQFGRAIDDFLNRPLTGLNSVLRTWVNFELANELREDN